MIKSREPKKADADINILLQLSKAQKRKRQ